MNKKIFSQKTFILHISPVGYSVFVQSKLSLSDKFKNLSSFPNFAQNCRLLSFYPLPIHKQSYADLASLAKGVCVDSLARFLAGILDPNTAVQVSSKTLADSLKKHDLLADHKVSANEKFVEFFHYLDLHLKRYLPEAARKDLCVRRKALAMYVFRETVMFDADKSDENLVQVYSILRELEHGFAELLTVFGKWLSTEGHLAKLSQIVLAIYKKFKKDCEEGPKVLVLEYYEQFFVRFLVGCEKRTVRLFLDALFAGLHRNSAVCETATLKLSKAIGLDSVVVADEVAALLSVLSTDLLCLLGRLENKQKECATFEAALKKKVVFAMPNLTQVAGHRLAAHLVEKAGSLLKLSMLHSNFVQLLGAEKKLFKALKKRTKTPKFGVINEHMSELLKNKKTSINKGVVCRLYSNKCALAARMDAYSDDRSGKFGKKLKKEIKETLATIENVTSKN